MKYIKRPDGKFEFRSDTGKQNYSQRNNEFTYVHPNNKALKMDAFSMCNVTSVCMALDYAGYDFPTGRFTQPEDNLCDFMFYGIGNEVQAEYERINPKMAKAWKDGAAGAFAPNLIHDLNVFATNRWMGRTVCTFRTARSIQEIFNEVRNNRPVILSGTYPYRYANGTTGTLGHINVLAGAIFANAGDARPETVIIDDPFGDYRANFGPTSQRNDIPMPWADFIKLQKDLNNQFTKWAYFIIPNETAVV